MNDPNESELRYINLNGFPEPIEVPAELEQMILAENEDMLLEEQAQTSEFRSLSGDGCCMPS